MLKKITKVSAKWCPPCKVYAETFRKVAGEEEFSGIEFSEIDIDDEESEYVVEKYGVRSVPTTILLDDDGSVIYKLSGNVSQGDLEQAIRNAYQNGKEEE